MRSRVGGDHTGVPYLWPTSLRLPRRPPKLVYLDLGHWISLAKASGGHAGGRDYAEALTACTDAARAGRAVFPISDTIYIEVGKIASHRQRRDLREVVERLSGFKVVTARHVISAHEIEALLNHLVAPNPQPIVEMDYLDWGVARALGLVGGFSVQSAAGEDVTAAVRASHPLGPQGVDALLGHAELLLNRQVLEGPTPEEEPTLREFGWHLARIREIGAKRAEQEIEQAARFDEEPQWRRGRIRDVVAAREILIEVNELLARGVAERGLALEQLFPKPQDARRAFDSMPSFDVAVSLKTELHRDSNHRWTSNDIHDIDALGSTLAYCDIVVTDKAIASAARRARLPERLGTTLLSSLHDLLACI
jgi:hypothetical protein